MDARQIRSRNALKAAILELATERPVDSLTVSEVAERAKVHRSTFYEHAASPVELLESVLRDELDAVREKNLAATEDADAAAIVTATTEAVLSHVDRYDVIYDRGLGANSGSGSLHSLLSEHFLESSRQLQERDAFSVPLRIDGMANDAVREGVAAYVAGGAVGAMRVWLTLPKPRDSRSFLELFTALVPSWWPTLGKTATGNVAVAAER
jgi:AcrR family transcriptional regulator